MVACQFHYLEVVGSIPTPASKFKGFEAHKDVRLAVNQMVVGSSPTFPANLCVYGRDGQCSGL